MRCPLQSSHYRSKYTFKVYLITNNKKLISNLKLNINKVIKTSILIQFCIIQFSFMIIKFEVTRKARNEILWAKRIHLVFIIIIILKYIKTFLAWQYSLSSIFLVLKNKSLFTKLCSSDEWKTGKRQKRCDRIFKKTFSYPFRVYF